MAELLGDRHTDSNSLEGSYGLSGSLSEPALFVIKKRNLHYIQDRPAWQSHRIDNRFYDKVGRSSVTDTLFFFRQPDFPHPG